MPKKSFETVCTQIHGQGTLSIASMAFTARRRLGDEAEKVCTGTAKEVAWVHHKSDPHVAHRNIRSGIIFSDEEYEARMSEFGFARLMNVEDSNCVTNSCCGEKADELVEEFGYDAPEAWRNSSVAILKGDVYSFRILVLEIITRLRLRDTIMDEVSRNGMTFLEGNRN